MIQVFDLKAMKAYPYEERDRNVFYKTREFKARILSFQPEERCQLVKWLLMVFSMLLRGKQK